MLATQPPLARWKRTVYIYIYKRIVQNVVMLAWHFLLNGTRALQCRKLSGSGLCSCCLGWRPRAAWRRLFVGASSFVPIGQSPGCQSPVWDSSDFESSRCADKRSTSALATAGATCQAAARTANWALRSLSLSPPDICNYILLSQVWQA